MPPFQARRVVGTKKEEFDTIIAHGFSPEHTPFASWNLRSW